MLQITRVEPINKRYVDMEKLYTEIQADKDNFSSEEYGISGALYGNALDKFKGAINAQIKDIEANGENVIGIGVIGNETPVLFIGEDK